MRTVVQLLTCIWLLAGTAFAAELVRGPEVEVGTNGVGVIAWETDVPTGGHAQLGTSLARLERHESDGVAKAHQVKFDRLLSGTEYFVVVGTARMSLATNSFRMPETGGKLSEAAKAPGKGAPKTATRVALTAPPARETWGNLPSLTDHYERHGADFKAKNAEDYARLAWEFLQRARSEGLPAKLDDDGVIRVFDRKSGTFASYNRDGTTKTFFKPGSADYFERQPGSPVKLQTLKFKP